MDQLPIGTFQTTAGFKVTTESAIALRKSWRISETTFTEEKDGKTTKLTPEQAKELLFQLSEQVIKDAEIAKKDKKVPDTSRNSMRVRSLLLPPFTIKFDTEEKELDRIVEGQKAFYNEILPILVEEFARRFLPKEEEK